MRMLKPRFIISLFVILFISLSAMAQSETAPAETAPAETAPAEMAPAETPQTDVPESSTDTPLGFFGIGGFAGRSTVEGSAQIMAPIHATESGVLFINPRVTYNDDDEKEANIGLVYRHLLPDRDMILGANIYYDSRWAGNGSHFNQIGLGLECLTEWVDARFNYYLPEDKQKVIGRKTTTTYAGKSTGKSYDQWAEGNAINEKTTTTTYDNYLKQTVTTTGGTLQGFDAEIGAKLPGIPDALEVRLFGGYYDFDSNLQGAGGISGFKARLEARVLPALYLDATVFENDELFGSDYLIGARLQLPLDLTRLADGKNPFVDVRESLKPAARGFSSRISDSVIRDPQIQLDTTTEVTSRIQREAIGRRSKTDPYMECVIFVDDDNDSGTEDGTRENPFNTVQEGVDASALSECETVYVFGGHYGENVMVEGGMPPPAPPAPGIENEAAIYLAGDLDLIGEGQPLGTDGGFGGGDHPVISGNMYVGPASLTIADMDGEVAVTGFRLTGGYLNGKIDESIALVNGFGGTGAAVYDSADVFFGNNIFEYAGAGLFASYGDDVPGAPPAGPAPASEPNGFGGSYLTVVDNQFRNLGVGTTVEAFDEDVRVSIENNTFDGIDRGVEIANFGESYVDASIRNNIFNRFGMYKVPMVYGPQNEGSLPEPDGFFDGGPGITAVSHFGAFMDVTIENNLLDGPALGIIAGTVDAGMYAEIYGNAVIGDGLLYGPGFRGELVGGIELDEGLLDLDDGFDDLLDGLIDGMDEYSGVAGIKIFAKNPDDGDSSEPGAAAAASPEPNGFENGTEAFIEDNLIQNHPVGVLAYASKGGYLSTEIAGNEMVDNLIGVAGIAEKGGYVDLDVYENEIEGGGTADLLSGFMGGGEPMDVADAGLAGVLGIATKGGELYTDIWANQINGHLIGVASINTKGGETYLGVYENEITGAGVSAAADLLSGFFGDGEPLDAADAGLAGVFGIAAKGGELYTEIAANQIDEHLIGVGGISTMGGYVDLGVYENHITGSGVSGVADILSGFLGDGEPLEVAESGLAGVLGLAVDGGELDAEIEGNETDDHLIGVLGAAILDSRIGYFDVIENDIDGDGARDLIDLLMDEDNPHEDFGLLGVGLIAYDESSIGESVIGGNLIDDHLVGIGALAIDNSSIGDIVPTAPPVKDDDIIVKRREGLLIVENRTTDSLIDIAGLSIDDSRLSAQIIDNRLNGGNLLPGIPFGAGVLLNSYDDSHLDALVEGNQIRKSAGVGLWASTGALPFFGTEGGDPSSLHVGAYGNTISGHGLLGVLTESYSDASLSVRLEENTIVNNDRSGELPEGVSSAMWGLVYDESDTEADIIDNTSDGDYLFSREPSAAWNLSDSGNTLEDGGTPAFINTFPWGSLPSLPLW